MQGTREKGWRGGATGQRSLGKAPKMQAAGLLHRNWCYDVLSGFGGDVGLAA